jgi:DNA-binding transcriptional LysR family regulator
LGPPCLFSLERARQILGELDDAENAARGLDSLRGTLRVALSGAFGIGEVIPVCLASRRSIRNYPSTPARSRRAGHRFDEVVAAHLQEAAIVEAILANEDRFHRVLMLS